MMELIVGIFALIAIVAIFVWISEEISCYMRNENLQDYDEMYYPEVMTR